MTLKVVTSGTASAAVSEFVPLLIANKIASRIVAKDFTIWGKDAESESSIRLGWVDSAKNSEPLVASIIALREEFAAKGVTRFVLCGMGGSSLAPEVITRTAGVKLTVLDSTNADQVRDALSGDLTKTAIIVSSKSGSTVETDSQKRIFEKAFMDAGIDKSDRIVIITDPGSPIESVAKVEGYRVFNADPNVGGRYNALTAFGIVPSGLAGADIATLLAEAREAAPLLALDIPENPALILGAALAKTYGEYGYRDKVALVSEDTTLIGFSDWAEQLIAESTGKLGKGILPIVLEPQSQELHSGLADLLTIRIIAEAANASGDEVVVSGSLGAQFLLWESATVIASHLIGVNPFDQPDVESAKLAARGMLEQRDTSIPALFKNSGIEVSATSLELSSATSITDAIKTLLAKVSDDEGYLAIQAYLDRNSVPEAAELRELFAKVTCRPVTFGWGPRFLHSTGQYHKGGPRHGVYLQIIAKATEDIQVPGRDFSFNELITSQASGDAKVLGALNLPVLTLTLDEAKAGIVAIKNAIS